MSLTPEEWHIRFRQQAEWTRDLRAYLFEKASLETAENIIEIGCGTGALLMEISKKTCGLDIDLTRLRLAQSNSPNAALICGDAHSLPYAPHSFDISFCHFFFLWVFDPERVLKELVRITKQGGVVITFAEPDYGGRIDYPPELTKLGEWQREALRDQGANPLMGRELAALFSNADLQDVETGVLSSYQNGVTSKQARDLEWQVLEADFESKVEPREMRRLQIIDDGAWERGERVLFVPTFYACGRVP
ncbi:MAG: methyltransferase domain-containing protein [Chloroflexi bacterium]|nr:methyltransferase domain-containing protein [Chloroflexota bacterium]